MKYYSKCEKCEKVVGLIERYMPFTSESLACPTCSELVWVRLLPPGVEDVARDEQMLLQV